VWSPVNGLGLVGSFLARKQGTLTEGGRPRIVDLLLLSNLDRLIFILKILFTFVTKQGTLTGGQPY
jgi:hypothetical protein